MSHSTVIEEVSHEYRIKALCSLAGGTVADSVVLSQARAILAGMQSRDDTDGCLWWARREGRCLGAAMTIEKAGNVGILFHSPPDTPGVEVDGLARAIIAASGQCLDSGNSLVQTLADPDNASVQEVLARTNLELMTELIYLNLQLPAKIKGAKTDGLSWRPFDDMPEQEQLALLASTYEQSLDCPELHGVRDSRDVLEGHRSAGVYRSDAWWSVAVEGEPAGCIMVNDSEYSGMADVVYLGVTMAYRRRGIARAMLSRAVQQAQLRGRNEIALAVDARNSIAAKLYEATGFKDVQRRLVYLAFDRKA